MQERYVNLSDPKFHLLSNEAKDLIKNMLIYSKNDRISAKNSLAHPWFKNPSKKNKHDFKEIIKNLKNFKVK